jgi:hypothetical protein
MFVTIGLIPVPIDIGARCAGKPGERTRVITIGLSTATLHVQTRGVLDRLQAALDEIRADMDAEEAADAGNELAAS